MQISSRINHLLLSSGPFVWAARKLPPGHLRKCRLSTWEMQRGRCRGMQDFTQYVTWELICTRGWSQLTDFANHVSQPFAGVASGIKVVRLCPSTLSVGQAEVSGTGCTFVATLELRNNFRKRSVPVLEPVGKLCQGLWPSHLFVDLHRWKQEEFLTVRVCGWYLISKV